MGEAPREAARALIERAERRMRDGVVAEIEAMDAGRLDGHVDQGKYEEAKALFARALEIDPDNMRALNGVSDCEVMLESHAPVQHLDRVDYPLDVPGLATTGEDIPPGRAPGATRRMPWEVLRDRRRRDRDGLAAMGLTFSEEAEDAKKRIATIIIKAVERARADPQSSLDIKATAAREIEEFQRQLHRGWKGHGPEVLAEALADLDSAFDSPG